jgi:hypothetical protein
MEEAGVTLRTARKVPMAEIQDGISDIVDVVRACPRNSGRPRKAPAQIPQIPEG